MAVTPQTIALSDIHKSFNEVKAKVEAKPTLVLRNNQPEAWLVSIEHWDAMQRAIQDYSRALEKAMEGKQTATLAELFEKAGVDPQNYEAVPA